MSADEHATVDRSGWRPGPWDREPDRWEGEHEGFPLLAVRNRMGAWCGYAAVPPGHPWYGRDAFREVDADAHGGLTYGDFCSGNICHTPKPGEPDNVYWLGFDCAHSNDLIPVMLALEDRHGWAPIFQRHGQYRTLDYVQGECRRLAAQAKAATTTPERP